MDALSLNQVAEACGGVLPRGGEAVRITGVSKDTRTLRSGDVYWALRGERFDGNAFVGEAAARGAAAAVVDANIDTAGLPDAFPLVRVSDGLRALQQLAAWHRSRLGCRVVCVTGSNGKTSTKDFMAAVAEARFRVTRTRGNYNNHVGLPLSILAADAAHDVAVWEIGMNKPGEIERLALLARPDIAIITNIGVAHIEFLGSRDAIAREKGMLAEALEPSGLLVLNAEDAYADAIAARARAQVRRAGLAAGDVRAENIRTGEEGTVFDVLWRGERARALVHAAGEHMVRNAVLAVAAGLELGLTLEECARGLESARLTGGRLEMKDIRGVRILDDTYNANPDSMEAALKTLRSLQGVRRRVAVLGRMGELGSYETEGYERVGRAAAANADILIAVGPETVAMADAARAAGLSGVVQAVNVVEAARLLREAVSPGDAVVIKGSRAARMERVIEEFA